VLKEWAADKSDSTPGREKLLQAAESWISTLSDEVEEEEEEEVSHTQGEYKYDEEDSYAEDYEEEDSYHREEPEDD
jgi:hypothetical protein